MKGSVFISGGNRGIGLETAAQMAKLGYQVIISARSLASGNEAVQLLEKKNITVQCVQMNIEDEQSVKLAAEAVSAKCNGKLDALINNAGVACTGGAGPTLDVNSVEQMIQTNLYGTIRVTNHFLPLVQKSSAGRIVNVSSICGSLESNVGGFAYAAYSISKAALNMYTVKLASSLESTPIKVNTAHPGWVKTDMGGPEAPLGVEEGAETSVFLATLPADGPTGGYFFKQDRLPW